MSDKAISPLRQRLIEDMAIRRLGPGPQHQYIRHVKRFADFLVRRSAAVGGKPTFAGPGSAARLRQKWPLWEPGSAHYPGGKPISGATFGTSQDASRR